MDVEYTGFNNPPIDHSVVLPPAPSSSEEVDEGFFQVSPEEEEECRQIEEECKSFRKEKVDEMLSLFAAFIPKTGVRQEECLGKFPDILKRIKQWRPLLDVSSRKMAEELKKEGEEWFRSAEYTEQELSKVNQELSNKITAFTETEPAFETAKKACNEFYLLYHSNIKTSLAELKKKYEETSEKISSHIQISRYCLTKEEKSLLTNIFDDTSQEEIESHLCDFSKQTPRFSEKKNEILKKWKDLSQEETKFKDNHDLFCFLIKRNSYLKNLQKTDFWIWRSSYYFINETTAPFPSCEQGKIEKKNSWKAQAISLPSLPSQDKKDFSLDSVESVRLSTRCMQQEQETQSEAITEDISEECEPTPKKEYMQFFKNKLESQKLAEELCMALISKLKMTSSKYLLRLDAVKDLISSCKPLPERSLLLQEDLLSSEVGDLVRTIGALSTYFKQQADEVSQLMSVRKNVDVLELENLFKKLISFQDEYKIKSLDLIKISEVKNQSIIKLNERIKKDNGVNFSPQAIQLISSVYGISRKELTRYQGDYHASTKSFTVQMKQVGDGFDTLNKSLLSFKKNFEYVCQAVNTDFSKTLFTQLSNSLLIWWKGAPSINQENLILKGMNISVILSDKENSSGDQVQKPADEEEGEEGGVLL